MFIDKCISIFSSSIPGDLIVRCGEWDLLSDQEPVSFQDRQVVKFSIHPSYNRRNVHNDFVLLHLESEFEPSIDTVCLPNEIDGELSYSKEGCVAMGWGKDGFGIDFILFFILIHS